MTAGSVVQCRFICMPCGRHGSGFFSLEHEIPGHVGKAIKGSPLDNKKRLVLQSGRWFGCCAAMSVVAEMCGLQLCLYCTSRI